MRLFGRYALAVLLCAWAFPVSQAEQPVVGREVAVERHLQDGEEFQLSISDLLRHGGLLFSANWTIQEGAGRPLTKGTGDPLADPTQRLVFPRNFNRVSAPDANSCAGCHNAPFGIAGGGGDIVANVFVLGQRFDFATFDGLNGIPGGGSLDELGRPVTLQNIGNSRNTLGMFGAGYIEMLARQITADLQSIRDRMPPGRRRPLTSKGISFGTLIRKADGSWDTSQVEGLAAPSLASSGPNQPPSLIIRPFHQAGAVISLRQFTNNAYNHHHGIQASERFGPGTDADGDGFVDELTRADVTAATLYQAALSVPGRVIPNNPVLEEAILRGEGLFEQVGCASCHIPELPLGQEGWIFTEPNPYNPAGNLRPGDAPEVAMDLSSDELPGPRLKPGGDGIVRVPAYTDLKLHDICAGPDDPNQEPLNMHHSAGSEQFFGGNRKFITKKLWGAANEPPYFHHGQFTTLREAIQAHDGEARASRLAMEALPAEDQAAVIEFLKTLQILPPGTAALIIDEKGRPKAWPPLGSRGARSNTRVR